MKHIESILPEHAAGEISRMLVGDDDATATAALTALLHNATGCDIPQTSDLPASEVEELVPLCVSILRRHWQTPLTCLGDGSTPMSLADLLRQTIGDRVQGNEALGIQAANANLPTAVAALTKRHIDDGLTLTLEDGTTMPCPDGLSLAQLLCGSDITDKVTEIVDSNTGWEWNKNISFLSIFPKLQMITINCKISNYPLFTDNAIIKKASYPKLEEAHIMGHHISVFKNLTACDEIELPVLRVFSTNFQGPELFYNVSCYKIELPKFEVFSSGNGSGLIEHCPNLKEVYAPITKQLSTYVNIHVFNNCQSLEKVVLNKVGYYNRTDSLFADSGYPNLIHLEIGHNGDMVDNSINFMNWNPTSVLSDSERLHIFLSNFKTYIAERLTDNGSGLTLTLSQSVRDAIQQDPEIVSIITSKGWTISPAPSV